LSPLHGLGFRVLGLGFRAHAVVFRFDGNDGGVDSSLPSDSGLRVSRFSAFYCLGFRLCDSRFLV